MARQFEIDVALDSSGVQSGANAATNALSGLAGQAGIVSTALRTAATAAVAFAGVKGIGAAINAAVRFEEQMQQLKGQVGLTQEEIDTIGKQTQQLAIDTGEATETIAEGYKFARSAGLDLAESQRLVETATKAAAVGFGSQRDLVRTATTAMNTWSDEIESGSNFLDNLTAAAQNMDIQVDGLSSAFRRNINVASQLNISLNETLASLGAVSGAVGDASRGGRLFQQVLVGLLSPTKEAKKEISGVFGSVQNLQNSIAQGGLIQTLNRLRGELERSGGGLDDVFTSSRRLEGALALTADEGKRAKEILSNLDNISGNVQKTFNNTDSTARNYRQIQQELNVLLKEFGEETLPTVNNAMNIFGFFLESQIDGLRAWKKILRGESFNFEELLGIDARDKIEDVIGGLRALSGVAGETVNQFTENDTFIPNEQVDKVRDRLMGMIETVPDDIRNRFGKKLASGVREARITLINDPSKALNAENILSFLQREVIDPASKNWTDSTKQAIKKGLKGGGADVDKVMEQQTVTAKQPPQQLPFGPVDAGNVVNKNLNDQFLPQPNFAQTVGSELERAKELEKSVRTVSDVKSEIREVKKLQPLLDDQTSNRLLKKLRDEMDRLKGKGQNTFNALESMTRQWGQQFSSTTAEMLATGEANFKGLAQSFIQDFLEVIVQRTVTNRALNLLLQGSMSGTGKGFLPTGLGIFGDTPGIQDAGPQGGVAGFAPGDKFVAAQSKEGLQRQVNDGTGGQTVMNQTVNNEFPVTSDKRIDRRIQKAAPRIADKAKRETLQAISSGGSDAQVARNA